MDSVRELTMWAGCYLNGFARQICRDMERITRPLKIQEDGYEETACKEATVRVKSIFRAICCLPLAAICTPLSTGCLTVAYCLDNSRLEIIDKGATVLTAQKTHTVNLLSLNVCFQDPFSPFAGGVVPPLDPVKGHSSRAVAIAHWIGHKKNAPDVFLGQEFTGLHAQDAFVDEMKKYGYKFFIVDRAPHPLFMNSGLLVASKYKLENISCIPFSYEDRFGGAKVVQNAAIRCSLSDTQNSTVLHLINTHLNAESGPKADQTRYTQLTKYVMPHFTNEKVRTVLMGDLNFDTSIGDSKRRSGLENFTNICEGKVTWTNEGVNHLRGNTPLSTENIDVIIANSPTIRFDDLDIAKVETEKKSLLTDHYAVSASVILDIAE